MGLDSVELLMRVEETFDIEISDDVAQKIVTVRDLIDVVYARIAHQPLTPCRTQRSFYRLRRGLQDSLGTQRNLIRPQASLEALIPRERRVEVWQKLKATTGAHGWPELRRSTADRAAIAALVATAALAAAVWISREAAIFAAIGSAAMLLALTTSRRVEFQPTLVTVGDLAEHISPEFAAELKPSGNRWTHEAARTAVRAIVVDQLGVDSSFSDDARFVEDLGVD